MDNLDIHFKSVEDGLTHLNSILDANERSIAILLLHFNNSRFRGRPSNDIVYTYLFKPTGHPARLEKKVCYDDSNILIPSDAYFVKQKNDWSSMIRAPNIIVPARFMHNFGHLDGPATYITTPWKSSDLLTKEHLDEYVAERFQGSIAFSKRYDILNKLK